MRKNIVLKVFVKRGNGSKNEETYQKYWESPQKYCEIPQKYLNKIKQKRISNSGKSISVLRRFHDTLNHLDHVI